ncbi:MAG: glycosyltransferase family 2 protein [Sulfuricurvum sp.]
MENKSISILMATYNGEKYLRQQLLSLIAQTYPHWQLWIKDDGSTDTTELIIDTFCTLDTRIQKVSFSENNLGVGKAFFSLLPYAHTPYTIFCDQDDIWLEKKLEKLVQYADEKLISNKVGMVYCDAYVYSDLSGTIISHRVSHLHAKNLNEFLFFNSGYQGCSILFNQPLAMMAQNYTADFYMHDDIISLLAHTFGDIYFLNTPLMLYRQHETNVTGKTAKGYLDMAQGFFRRDATVLSHRHYEEKKAFLTYYKTAISDKNILLFEAYLNFVTVSLFKRLVIILTHRFSLGGHKMVLLLKTLLRKPLG